MFAGVQTAFAPRRTAPLGAAVNRLSAYPPAAAAAAEQFFGDTIRSRTTVKKIRESKSRPNAGIVSFLHQGFNQRGEEVCTCLERACE